MPTTNDAIQYFHSKGVVLAWTSTLQQSLLGDAALGFRAGAGTVHVAQLLSEIIVLQRQRRIAQKVTALEAGRGRSGGRP